MHARIVYAALGLFAFELHPAPAKAQLAVPTGAATTRLEAAGQLAPENGAAKNRAQFQGGRFLVHDQEGHLLWSAALPPGSSHGIAVPSADSAWILAFKCADERLCLRRYDQNGSELWHREVDEERYPAKICAAPDDSFLVVLNFAVTSPVLGKYDAHGRALWQWQSPHHYLVDLDCSSEHEVVVLGHLSRMNGGYWLTKLDRHGAVKWMKNARPKKMNHRWWVRALNANGAGDIVIHVEEEWRRSAREPWQIRRFSQTWRPDGQLIARRTQTVAQPSKTSVR